MKSLISVSLIFGVLVAFGSDLIVPRTCTEQIENEPLNVGALAYRLAAEGDVADLTIGGERGTKVQVIDRTGIHGYREKEVANDDFVVTHSEGVIFDVMTDTYRVDTTSSAQFGVTNWVKCTIPIGRIICSVGREIVNKRSDVTFGGAPVGDVVERIEGNEWTMVLIWNKVVSDAPAQGTLSVARIKPKFLAVGSKNWVNDLIRTEFPMRDTLGELGLGKWREWARDYIDRADYTHWANAPATNNVAMNGKSIIFDPNGRYEIFASPSSNLVIQAGGVQGLEFDFHGVPLSGALRFTGFDYLNGVASIEYFQDIDGFDPTQLVIQEADSIVRPISWQTVVPTRVVSLTDHSYQIIGISGPQKFYRMVYNGEQTAVLTIVIRGQLNVTGDIGFNGTTLTQELGDLRAEIAAHAPGNYETVSNRAMTALQEHQSLEPATNYTDAVTLAATNALDTTLRAEIAAHAPANYAAVSNAAIYASNTVANIHIDAEDPTFSNAVVNVRLPFGYDSVTNAVAMLNDFKEAFGDLGTGDIVGGAGTIGTIILALIGAVAWLKKNKADKSELPYHANVTATLKDRAFNALTFDGTEYNLSTALAAVTPTASGQPRDLLIVATATAATTISFTAGAIKGDKPTIDGAGTWLITLTEYASGVWYCRQIKMEDAA